MVSASGRPATTVSSVSSGLASVTSLWIPVSRRWSEKSGNFVGGWKAHLKICPGHFPPNARDSRVPVAVVCDSCRLVDRILLRERLALAERLFPLGHYRARGCRPFQHSSAIFLSRIIDRPSAGAPCSLGVHRFRQFSGVSVFEQPATHARASKSTTWPI